MVIRQSHLPCGKHISARVSTDYLEAASVTHANPDTQEIAGRGIQTPKKSPIEAVELYIQSRVKYHTENDRAGRCFVSVWIPSSGTIRR